MNTYYMPTKIIKGEGCVLDSPNLLILGKKAFIVTGKHSGALSGALDDVKSVLENNKIPYHVYDKIENNPEISDMAEGGRMCREFGADFIVAIGGGSPLDAAKAISVYCTNEPRACSDFTLYDIFSGQFKNDPLPMCAIPTTAGTGSEVTPYSILTLHKEQTKRSFSSPLVFYKAAFLDPKYTANLPLQITRNTAVDAMCHLLEGYTNKKSSNLTDYMAIEGLRLIGECKNGLLTGEISMEERDKLLYASCLGGIVISQTGTTVVHSMGYALTYFHDIPHGMANGYLVYGYLIQKIYYRRDKCNHRKYQKYSGPENMSLGCTGILSNLNSLDAYVDLRPKEQGRYCQKDDFCDKHDVSGCAFGNSGVVDFSKAKLS